jgi:predicted dehydrogenase
VLVTNPHVHHTEVALAALAAGKHVLVEKPMCMTLREADAIIEAQRATGLTVQVGTIRRYAPAFVEACRLVGELGQIHLARVRDVLGHNALVTTQATRVIRGEVPAAGIEAGRAAHARLIDEAIGAAAPALQSAYSLMLGLSTHDTSAMRELLGQPRGVLFAAQRHGGRWLTAAFDYGDFVCQFETGIDDIPRFDGHLEVYGADRVIRVEYDTPYVRNLPVRLRVTAAHGRDGVSEQAIQPDWSDPFVAEWRAFHDNVTQGRAAKTSPADFREDLELYAEMIRLMR